MSPKMLFQTGVHLRGVRGFVPQDFEPLLLNKRLLSLKSKSLPPGAITSKGVVAQDNDAGTNPYVLCRACSSSVMACMLTCACMRT